MINGMINVYKEAGYTSHDVVAKLRGILRQKKIGHTGTLDPGATGVLPVCLGKATRALSLMEDQDKSYLAVLRLGLETDTEDMSGTVIEERDPSGKSEEEVLGAIRSFEGAYDQIPPMYSAKKKGGRKLYELAREGIVVERDPVRVMIHEIRVEKTDLPRVTFAVTCSKGTYVRSLCRDIGRKLGCGACMESLVRTRAGSFCLADALTLSEIEDRVREGTIAEAVLPLDQIFLEDPAAVVLAEGEKFLRNGNPVSIKSLTGRDGRSGEDLMKASRIRVYNEAGSFFGLYRYAGNHIFKVVRMFI